MPAVRAVTALCALSVLALLCPVQGLIEGLYCGVQNCYDVLGVTRDSEKADIARAYRKQARIYHPDKYKGEDAEEKFQLVATAYEVLKDEEQRADYDYLLDNPEEYLTHYYMYYRRRVAPKVDVRLVILGTILSISVVQYISWWTSYNSAIHYALLQPRYRTKARELALSQGLLKDPQELKRKWKMNKEEIKAEEEKVLTKVLEDNLTITGGHSKPRLFDVLLFKIVFSPYTIVIYVKWQLTWAWKFTICKEEFGPEEHSYLTRKKLGLSELQWQMMEPATQETMLGKQLWIEENFKVYKEEKAEEERLKMAESSRYKQYKRYMRNNKPGRMTFIDE